MTLYQTWHRLWTSSWLFTCVELQRLEKQLLHCCWKSTISTKAPPYFISILGRITFRKGTFGAISSGVSMKPTGTGACQPIKGSAILCSLSMRHKRRIRTRYFGIGCSRISLVMAETYGSAYSVHTVAPGQAYRNMPSRANGCLCGLTEPIVFP